MSAIKRPGDPIIIRNFGIQYRGPARNIQYYVVIAPSKRVMGQHPNLPGGVPDAWIFGLTATVPEAADWTTFRFQEGSFGIFPNLPAGKYDGLIAVGEYITGVNFATWWEATQHWSLEGWENRSDWDDDVYEVLDVGAAARVPVTLAEDATARDREKALVVFAKATSDIQVAGVGRVRELAPTGYLLQDANADWI